MRRGGAVLVTAATMLALAAFAVTARADPTAEQIVAPLPVIVPTASSWQPQFPFPYDQTRGLVRDADINAEREMCQWYNAQYDTLMTQIDNFNANLTRSNDDYSTGGNEQLADILASNIEQSVAFLAPRAQALTVSTDFAGDVFFPLYQGESFYRLWQQLSNVGAGVRARQPQWFYGPSIQHALRWGERINRSHVCR